MKKNCRQCAQPFEITEDDLKFYDKISPVFGGKKYTIPAPTLCPDCRQQRRLAFRNERKLYHRKCDRTGKEIISLYSPDKPFQIYDRESWWSDEWDPMEFGKDFDFNKTFFEQFSELQLKVPRLGIFTQNCQNSDYTNQSYNNKNSYLCSAIGDSQDIFYVQNSTNLSNGMDSSFCQDSELLYGAIDVFNSYQCVNIQNCTQCSDSAFLYDCSNCKNCFGCIGLRNKQYCLWNKQLTQEEYLKELESFALNRESNLAKYRQLFQKFMLNFPHKATWIKNSENVHGNNIKNSRNAMNCFDVFEIEDCKYSTWIFKSKDVYDAYGTGKSQLIYEGIGVEEVDKVCFSQVTSNSHECFYAELCFYSQHLFGCIGLRSKSYCILNKQYTKEEYEHLVPKIIEHMRKTGEWGEFFPISISPFAYNETAAQEYFPLTKEQAIKHGGKWKEEDQLNRYQGLRVEIPDDISEVNDEITKKILTCEDCEKNYKIIEPELKFYRQLRLPIPRNCPDCRYKARLSMRNPRKLFSRACLCTQGTHSTHAGQSCGTTIQTTYAPDRPEKVYCEKCYLEAVY